MQLQLKGKVLQKQNIVPCNLLIFCNEKELADATHYSRKLVRYVLPDNLVLAVEPK